MSALRHSRTSDILAATGKAETQVGAGERFWTKRRIVLGIGYALAFAVGVAIVFAADPTGLVLMLAAVLGVLFLHRTWLGLVVWTYVLVSGIVAITGGDDFGFYGVAAGIGFGLVALPAWTRRPASARFAYQYQPAFIPPISQPVNQPPAVDRSAAVAPPPVEASEAPAERPSGPRFVPTIRAIGRIQIVTGTGDLTSELLRKPVVGFMWLYLLARSVLKPQEPITRAELIDEVAHSVKDPRKRLRDYLSDLGRLPEPMAAMVKAEPGAELVGFDLNGVEADYAELTAVAQQIRDS